MKNSLLLILGITSILISSCSTANVFYSPDAHTRANHHQIIAIIPPKVSIEVKKKVDAEAIKEQQENESINFQKETQSWLLKQKMKSRIFVDIQDIETTNALLKQTGYSDDNLMTPIEICEVLGVDGIITSNYSLSKPMSTGGAIAVGVLVGVWGSTNQTAVTLEIHDRETKKLIWNYHHQVSGSVGSSPAQLVANLMNSAGITMPYYRKKRTPNQVNSSAIN